jgi:hypothetical protein
MYVLLSARLSPMDHNARVVWDNLVGGACKGKRRAGVEEGRSGGGQEWRRAE